jgi:hypothetical protein
MGLLARPHRICEAKSVSVIIETTPPITCPIIHTAPIRAAIRPLSHGPRLFFTTAPLRIHRRTGPTARKRSGAHQNPHVRTLGPVTTSVLSIASSYPSARTGGLRCAVGRSFSWRWAAPTFLPETLIARTGLAIASSKRSVHASSTTTTVTGTATWSAAAATLARHLGTRSRSLWAGTTTTISRKVGPIAAAGRPRNC